MIWIILAVAAIGVCGFFEWRSRNTPLSPGLKNHWDAHNAALNHERPLTGGHDADGRH
jgi:hypothetical protein